MVLDTPIGPLGLVASAEGLQRRLLRRQAESVRKAARLCWPRHPASLEAYFEGRVAGLRPTRSSSTGTEFQRRCWLALGSIPYGQTVS
jgi:O6-methylguanine-DNA--protein-cysteine methyltransferase